MLSLLHLFSRSHRRSAAAAAPAIALALLLVLPATLLPLPACSGDAPAAPADTTGRTDTTGREDSTISYQDPVILCTVEDVRLGEISGIAPSRYSDGIFWVHNDSGGEARLFAVDSSGRTLATVLLTGAANRDWEDIASATLGGESWLYVGDIGDNDRLRDAVTVYRVREPAVASAWRDSTMARTAESARFRYPDGARDCEALMVDARDGAVLLLEKNGTTCGVYRAAWPGDGGEAVLARIAVFRIPLELSFLRLVTAADLHPNGRRVLVRTYTTLFEYETAAGNPLQAVFDSTAARTLPTPGLTQSEAACYSRDGTDIVTTTEGLNPPLLILRRKH